MNKSEIWNILENNSDDKITSLFNNAMILIISLNIIAFILETEKEFYEILDKWYNTDLFEQDNHGVWHKKFKVGKGLNK